MRRRRKRAPVLSWGAVDRATAQSIEVALGVQLYSTRTVRVHARVLYTYVYGSTFARKYQWNIYFRKYTTVRRYKCTRVYSTQRCSPTCSYESTCTTTVVCRTFICQARYLHILARYSTFIFLDNVVHVQYAPSKIKYESTRLHVHFGIILWGISYSTWHR
jgi:hypothetical protein